MIDIKLFGKSLFSASRSRADALFEMSSPKKYESKFLLDFYKSSNSLDNFIALEGLVQRVEGTPTATKKEEPKKEENPATPKGVYEAKMLHDMSFELNTNPGYVDGQIEDFKDKLSLIKSEEYDMRRGVEEITSILMRMENRKKYPEVSTFFEEFPYTTSSKIAELVARHTNLELGQVAQFLADMPKEAVQVMKDYNKNTDKVCGKQAVFYIIADKKDFKKSNTRRDPILLAQSPFAHAWQILGAWDEEMLFIEEL